MDIKNNIYGFGLRKMEKSDLRFFNRVRNLCREYLHDSSHYTLAESISWFTDSKPEFYILSYVGHDIGYFRTSDRTDVGLKIGLDIHPSYQSRGLAIPAYEMFMQYMYDIDGIYEFTLNVLSSNETAINLYDRLGFELVCEEVMYGRDCSDYGMLCDYRKQDYKFDDVRYIASHLSNYDLLEFRDATIFITGTNGFIGKWLVMIFEYLNKKHRLDMCIIASDVDPRPNMKLTTAIYRRLNIVDTDALYREFEDRQIDYIFNCAGIANPSSYMRNPVATLDVSYIGTKNILDLALMKRVKSVVCFSSSEIYGTPEAKSIPTNESHIGRINTRGNRSCYDVGKLVLETICHVHHETSGVPVKTIRPFNLYGPHMNDTRVIPNFMRKVIWGESLNVYGKGNQTRTFCYVADAMVMLLKLALHGDNGAVYNIGNDSPEITMPELVDSISSALNIDLTHELIEYPDDYPDDEPMRRCPDISATKSTIGYSPRIPLDIGLKNTYNYFTKLLTNRNS